MAFKFIIALTFVAVASAGIIPVHHEYHAAPQAHAGPRSYAAPQAYAVAQPAYAKAEESYDSHPKYQFSYAVHDEHTGDIKSQSESRDGDVVKGEYSLVDSDGHKRIVHYTADHHNGFNAVVHREPLGYEVKAAPAAYVAPAVIKSAPVAYAPAPVLQYGHASHSHGAAQAYNYHH